MTDETIIRAPRSGEARETLFGYVTRDHPSLDRVQNGISAVCGVIAGLAVVCILVLTLTSIVARVLFDSPMGWSIGFIRTYLLPLATFFGMVTAYRSGAHVAVVSLFERMAPVGKKVLLVLAYVSVLICLAALIAGGLSGVMFSVQIAQGPIPISSELPIPGVIRQMIMPLASTLGAVVVVIDLWRELTQPIRSDEASMSASEGSATSVKGE